MDIKTLLSNDNNLIYYDEFGDYLFVIDIKNNIYSIYYVESSNSICCLKSIKIIDSGNLIIPVENEKNIIFGTSNNLIIFDKLNLQISQELGKKVEYFICGEQEINSLKMRYIKNKQYKCAVYREYLISDGERLHLINDKINQAISFKNIKDIEKVRAFSDGIYIVNDKYVCSINKYGCLDEFDRTCEVF